jgi:hypothetical protein
MNGFGPGETLAFLFVFFQRLCVHDVNDEAF